MARRKTSKLTARQRESQRIKREKDARKKRQALVRKVQYGFALVAVMVVGITSFWIWKHSLVSYAYNAVVNGAYQITAKSGFAFEAMYLEGRHRTPVSEIRKAVNLKKGDPILQVSLAEMRQRLEAISSIQSASVERELPGRLHISIAERQPVAIWQYNGKYTLVDDNGVAMPDLDVSQHANLPLIVGRGAPAHVGEVLHLLRAEQKLAGRVKAAVRISSRRWNIHLEDKKEIKLPEKNPVSAWLHLAEMHEKQSLLDRDVEVIDLRVNGRLFITLPEQVTPIKTSGAQET